MKKNSELRSNLEKLWPNTKSALVVGMQYKSKKKNTGNTVKYKSESHPRSVSILKKTPYPRKIPNNKCIIQ